MTCGCPFCKDLRSKLNINNYYRNPGSPDQRLRALETALSQFPADEQIRQALRQERLRAGLPIYKIKGYLEMWDEHEDQNDAHILILFEYRDATLVDLLKEAYELDITDPDNHSRSGMWLSPLAEDTQYDTYASKYLDPVPDIDEFAGYITQVNTALEVVYWDGAELSEDDINLIVEALEAL